VVELLPALDVVEVVLALPLLVSPVLVEGAELVLVAEDDVSDAEVVDDSELVADSETLEEREPEDERDALDDGSEELAELSRVELPLPEPLFVEWLSEPLLWLSLPVVWVSEPVSVPLVWVSLPLE
jgi:hypothetical protein